MSLSLAVERILAHSVPCGKFLKKEDFDEQGGGAIQFFDEHGHSLGSVSISHDNYIYDSRNATTYKARDKDASIISCLENLDLKE